MVKRMVSLLTENCFKRDAWNKNDFMIMILN
jgi:hypothetical protein